MTSCVQGVSGVIFAAVYLLWAYQRVFHGKAEEHVVVHFRHESTFDTRFGAFESLAAD